MTNQEKFDKAVEKRVGLISAMNQQSTQTQALLEFEETEKAKICMQWLLSVADERKNKKLYDSITLLNRRLEKSSKLISDLMHYEAKASYYEMLCNSLRNGEEQIKKMEELLVKIQSEKF